MLDGSFLLFTGGIFGRRQDSRLDPLDPLFEIRQDLLGGGLIPASCRDLDKRLDMIPVSSEVGRAFLPDDLASVVEGDDRCRDPLRLAPSPLPPCGQLAADLDDFGAGRYRTCR